MAPVRIEISPEPIDVGARAGGFSAWAAEAGCGAVASFTGLARAWAGQDPVLALELQIYEGFSQAMIAQAVQAIAEAEGLAAVEVVHRHGEIGPGQAIVWVAAAAAHRRAAHRGCERLMDWLKLEAPIWKRERRNQGWVWIEPTEQDRIDARRWHG